MFRECFLPMSIVVLFHMHGNIIRRHLIKLRQMRSKESGVGAQIKR